MLHAIFESHFERRASSTKRLHNTRAKTSRRALRITQLLFEILLLCLRRTRLERQPSTNRLEIDDNPPPIDPKSTKNQSWAILGPKAVSGMRPDALGTACGHPNASPKPILGRPRHAKSGQEPSKSVARAPQRRSKSLQDSS